MLNNKWKNLFVGFKVNILKRLKRFARSKMHHWFDRYDGMEIDNFRSILTQDSYKKSIFYLYRTTYNQCISNSPFSLSTYHLPTNTRITQNFCLLM